MNNKDKKSNLPAVTREQEEAKLFEIIELVEAKLQEAQADSVQLEEELHSILEHYGNNDKEVQVLWNNAKARYYETHEDIARLKKARLKPYFGRIDFSTQENEKSFYIGRVGISDMQHRPLVVDWRTPVASVYYDNNLGPCSYEVKGEGSYQINLKRKRTYEIKEDQLIDFYDSDVVANDELLTKYLAKSKKSVLNEIIGTIQKEQNAVIRKSPKTNLIVQGAAGSGKTTVAMHRISYILYNYKEFRPEDFYIVGSNRILLNYITGVLPDLDVYGVSQMTMEELFVRLLYEDWDKEQYKIRAADKKNKNEWVKGTSKWFQDLEQFCDHYEKETIPLKKVVIKSSKVTLMEAKRIRDYLKEFPKVSMQGKINMLNETLLSLLENEIADKDVTYSAEDKKALKKEFKTYFGKDTWKGSIYDLYQDFLNQQEEKGKAVYREENAYDVYDLAALAYIYKRIKETDGIREASHIIIDEAQDFGMMAYHSLVYCLRGCTYTIMGDVSQNIQAGYGLNSWTELNKILINGTFGSFDILKKSYRNTVEISHFATEILRHGDFSIYPIEPIIRHGKPVKIHAFDDEEEMLVKAAGILKLWQEEGHETIAVICRDKTEATQIQEGLRKYIAVEDIELETAQFNKGIMVLPVEYTKGLEFDCVLLYNPTKEKYPERNQYVKLLYVAATRALHELTVVYSGVLSDILAKSVDEKKELKLLQSEVGIQQVEKEKQKEKQTSQAIQKPISKSAETNERIENKEQEIEEERIKKRPPSFREKKINPSSFAFGVTVGNALLKSPHGTPIACAIKGVKKEETYLEFLCVDGTLRLTPITENVVRIQFQKGIYAGIEPVYWDVHPDKNLEWALKKNSTHYGLFAGNVVIKIAMKTGALLIGNKQKKLLEEDPVLLRTVEAKSQGITARNFFKWTKEEKLFAKGILDTELLQMNGKARCISFGKKPMRMPLLISDKGYGIAVAAENTVMCCDIPMYGTQIYTEGQDLIDYYFIHGETKEDIMKIYRNILSV